METRLKVRESAPRVILLCVTERVTISSNGLPVLFERMTIFGSSWCKKR